MLNIQVEMSSTGAFTPDDVACIRSVFQEIIAEPWFSRSPQRQQDFALCVINAYRRGLDCPDRLRAVCLETAMENFAG
jgi:hypothetical protein